MRLMCSPEGFSKVMPPIVAYPFIHSTNTEQLLCAKHWEHKRARWAWRSLGHPLLCPISKVGSLTWHCTKATAHNGRLPQERSAHCENLDKLSQKPTVVLSCTLSHCPPRHLLEVLMLVFPHCPWHILEPHSSAHSPSCSDLCLPL